MDKLSERELPVTREVIEAPTVTGEKLGGYAILYGRRSKLITENGSSFHEVIDRGAFDLTRNVTFVYRHDDGAEYGDTASGSLRLTEDEHGVRFELDLPPYAHSLRRAVADGTVGGMSFSFYPRQVEVRDGIRHVVKGELLHVSAVFNPAYETGRPRITKPQSIDTMKKKMDLAEKI